MSSAEDSASPRGTDHTARLLMSCPDGPGIVASVSSFLHDRGANIVASDQFSTDPERGTFFMRVAFHLPALELAREREAFEGAFAALARGFAMQWRIAYARHVRAVALMASLEDHCLLDLLWRWRRGELPMRPLCVIANHPDLREEVESFDVPFVEITVRAGHREEAEQRALEELGGRAELVVLARYMQILSGAFLASVGCPVINIHHSFLPAFMGAEPYRRAHARGVKLIGATAHYATEDLDEGPIIEQGVERVEHQHTVADLKRVGRDLERVVLARAVLSELEDRVVVHEGRTIVF